MCNPQAYLVYGMFTVTHTGPHWAYGTPVYPQPGLYRTYFALPGCTTRRAALASLHTWLASRVPGAVWVPGTLHAYPQP